MRILSFINSLGLGGTEQAACRWARGLQQRGHDIAIVALETGPRRDEFTQVGIPVTVPARDPVLIRNVIKDWRPDVIHAHAPGTPHAGDLLGAALAGTKHTPVVQTNIFGRFDNPSENAWTDFRLFISWTSCVQAALRARRKLDLRFFEMNSVAVYPLDPDSNPPDEEIAAFRHSIGVSDNEVLFGRFARPDPAKWTDMPLEAFMKVAHDAPVRLLLQDCPGHIAAALKSSRFGDRIVVRPMVADPAELRLSLSSIDAALHTSLTGESFGYGIALPMNYGKPVIANPTPWGDQAQIELVKHGTCGFLAATQSATAHAIRNLAGDPALRHRMGAAARIHIRQVADTGTSLDRLESAMTSAIERTPNPLAQIDLEKALQAQQVLRTFGYGATSQERLKLRTMSAAMKVEGLVSRICRIVSPNRRSNIN